MEYKSLTTIVFAIMLFILALFTALYIYIGGSWLVVILAFIAMSVGLLVFKVPIDRYGFKLFGVDIDDKLMGALETEYPQINQYSTEQKQVFRKRMFYFLFDRDPYLVLDEPEKLDLYHTALIMAPGVIIGMENESFDEARDIERVVAYKHAFPSPKMKFLHTTEYDDEDGVIINSTEHLMLGLREPRKYYHISFHAWATRYVSKNGDFPEAPIGFIEELPFIFGFDVEHIEQNLGYKNPDQKVLALVSYFTSNAFLTQKFPSYSAEIGRFLSLH